MHEGVRRAYLPPNLVYGAGAIGQLGDIACQYGRVALVVTHAPGRFTASGIPANSERILQGAGVATSRFAVEREPSVATIDAGAAFARQQAAEVVIGIGGGSALDAAKAIAAMAVHDGTTEDYQLGRRVLTTQPLRVIAVPTTAGTGSEVSRVSVLLNPGLRVRKSIGDPRLVPTVAVLDPELTVGCSKEQTVSVGLDALAHAIESNVSLEATAFSNAVGLEAVRLLSSALPATVRDGADPDARGNALYGSSLAGMALNAGVGIAHILAQPISAVTDLPHATVVSILLPHVVAANARYAEEAYGRLATAAVGRPVSRARGAAVLRERIDTLQDAGGIPVRFSDLGVTQSQLSDAVQVALKWQGHITTNPRPVNESLLTSVVDAAL